MEPTHRQGRVGQASIWKEAYLIKRLGAGFLKPHFIKPLVRGYSPICDVQPGSERTPNHPSRTTNRSEDSVFKDSSMTSKKLQNTSHTAFHSGQLNHSSAVQQSPLYSKALSVAQASWFVLSTLSSQSTCDVIHTVLVLVDNICLTFVVVTGPSCHSGEGARLLEESVPPQQGEAPLPRR